MSIVGNNFKPTTILISLKKYSLRIINIYPAKKETGHFDIRKLF